MSSRTIAAAAAALAVAIAPGAAHAADTARAAIINPEGAVIGQATFEQAPTGVLVFVDVRDLPPGAHGIHLHAVGSCTPDFKAATGHINPGKVAHGLRNPDGPDNGDLPNLYVRRGRHRAGGVLLDARLGLGRDDAGDSG